MRPPTFLLALLFPASLALAQVSPAKLPPLPPGPIVMDVPERAAWKVVYRAPKSAEKQEKAADETTPAQRKPLRNISYIKTGDLAQVIETDTNGKSQLRFYFSGKEFNQIKGGGWVVSTSMIPLSGFSDFSWVAGKNYVAVAIVENQLCYIFQDMVQYLNWDSPVLTRAAVGVKSRLPVQLLIGMESQVYEFLKPPEQPLEVPPGVADLFEKQKKLGEAMMRRPH